MSDRRRLSGDGGAVMLEFVLLVPFLSLITFGIIDLGYAYRQENVLEIGVSTAARTNTQMSKRRSADYEMLRSISATANSMTNMTLTKVIVWEANGSDTPPAACKSIVVSPTGLTAKGVANSCNVYSLAQVETAQPTGFPAGSSTNPTCAGAWDVNWCPVGTATGARINADGSGDYLGVYIEMVYTPLTRIVIPNGITVTEQAIYRLEPPFIGG
jgi:Flp pilus assembly protein TadG